jgi:RNA polymerase sigma-70 factor (ECF subfamily)
MPGEEVLLQDLQSADPTAALATLFDSYADPVYRLALGLLGNPGQAEDVVQDTFLSVMTHRMTFEGRSRLSTWIYRIAYNASLERLRKKKEVPLAVEENDDDDEFIPLPQSLVEWRWTAEELLVDSEGQKILDKAIQTLSPALRAVFLLRDVEELSIEETSDALGLTTSAVKVRLHRARLALREQLSSYFIGQMAGGKQK